MDAEHLAMAGHNVLITGLPGTGKSTTLSRIFDAQIMQKKVVRLTASTGKAAIALKEKLTSKAAPVVTVHRYVGLRDGRFISEELSLKIQNDDDFKHYQSNICNIDTLIIDEVSMISQKIFEQIEFVFRTVRKVNKPFGGVQMILAGDFFQLPPVPNKDYADEGSFIVTSPHISTFHHVNLLDVHRQDEMDFTKAIHEIASGTISTESEKLIQRLSRGLPPGAEPVKLFARNFDVDICNAKHLREMEGEEQVYVAKDEGDARNIAGEKELHLKLGCPVILNVNLSDELVNGLTGTVRQTNEDSVHVYFQSLQRTEILKSHTFTKYDLERKQDIGCRIQIPLKLCFAMTVHKAQGLTIERVIIDCRNMVQYGQIAVGISRVPKKKGIQILNFSKLLLRKTPTVLLRFYETPPIPIHSDMSCCAMRSEHQDPIHQVVACDERAYIDDGFNSDDEMITLSDDENLVNALDSIEKDLANTPPDFPTPTDVDPQIFIRNIIHDHIITTQQTEENKAAHYLLENRDEVKKFVDFLWGRIQPMRDKCLSPDIKIENRNLTEFYKEYNKFLTGQEYKTQAMNLFGQNLSSAQSNVLFKLTTQVRKELISRQSFPIKEAAKEKADKETGKIFIESPGGRGKIRYIAGWCLYCLKKKRKKKLTTHIYNKRKVKLVEQLLLEKQVLEHLECSEIELQEHSNDKETLKFTENRQNIHRGLTNVSDSSFQFFSLLDKKVRLLQTESNLNLHGADFAKYLEGELINDTTVLQSWKNLFASCNIQNVDFTSCIERVFNEVICKYTMMSISQLRKEYLQNKHAKKKEATRKQIKMRTVSLKVQKFDIKVIHEDSSESREYSHKRLQCELLQDDTYLERTFTKLDLHKLCEAYGVKSYKSLTTKNKLANTLRPVILNSLQMSNSTVFTDSIQPSTSSTVVETESVTEGPTNIMEAPASATTNLPSKTRKRRKMLGKGKGKKGKKHIQWPCGICKKDASENSVGCDGCDTWYHSDCLQIEDMDSLPDEWFCQNCKECNA